MALWLALLELEGTDGCQWRVVADAAAAPPIGAVIEATRGEETPRTSDLMIATIAARHNGRYSGDIHAADDPRASAEFRLGHKRRLEALRRAGIVEHERDGSSRIPEDFLGRAVRFASERSAARIRVLSWVGLDQLAEARGATFLEDILEKRLAVETVESAFGAALGLCGKWSLTILKNASASLPCPSKPRGFGAGRVIVSPWRPTGLDRERRARFRHRCRQGAP